MNHGDELTEHDRPTTDDLLPNHTSDLDDDDLSAREVAVDSDADSEALADKDVDGTTADRHLTGEPTASPDRTTVGDPDLSDDRTVLAERNDSPDRTMRNDDESVLDDQPTSANGHTMADTRSTTGERATAGASPSTTDEPEDTPLFASAEVERFRTQWREVQAAFVDSPRQAVQEADVLVAEVMQNLAATFADHKHSLESQWSGGNEAETEELRLALRRYRSFFNQLLSV
jgi:hypothetical protein